MHFQKPGQQSFGSLGVAPGLNDFVQHVTVLIEGAPEPVFLTSNNDGCVAKSQFGRERLSAGHSYAASAANVWKGLAPLTGI